MNTAVALSSTEYSAELLIRAIFINRLFETRQVYFRENWPKFRELSGENLWSKIPILV